jgi:hypothetical protein
MLDKDFEVEWLKPEFGVRSSGFGVRSKILSISSFEDKYLDKNK